jgi:hypothetical protein
LFFPDSPCDRLPESAYDAQVTAAVSRSQDQPLDLESVVIDLDIGHIGRGSPWLGTRALAGPSGCGRTQILFTVFDEDREIIYRNAVAIPRTIFPGEGVHVKSKLAAGARESVPTLRPEQSYTLSIRLEQVGVRYFGGAKLSAVSLTP